MGRLRPIFLALALILASSLPRIPFSGHVWVLRSLTQKLNAHKILHDLGE